MVKVAAHACEGFQGFGHVIDMDFELLHAHTIGGHGFSPGHEALGGGRTDAVEVQ